MIPQYSNSVDTVVKFADIEAEVRCGRYYLSVWVAQAKQDPSNLFVIPQSEEQEFHSKLRAELRLCIEVEAFKDRVKIITLLKSCLLALKKFTLKRIVCLPEIKRILVHTASLQAKDGSRDGGDIQMKKMILFTGLRIV